LVAEFREKTVKKLFISFTVLKNDENKKQFTVFYLCINALKKTKLLKTAVFTRCGKVRPGKESFERLLCENMDHSYLPNLGFLIDS
jgi:hypothetical protein